MKNELLLWSKIAWFDVKSKYRRTVIGPFWMTISNGIIILFLALIYSKVLSRNLYEFFPYLSVGYIIWVFISTSLVEGNISFISYKHILLNIKIKSYFLVYRVMIRNIFVFFHNALIIAFVLIYFDINIDLKNFLYAFLGFTLLALNLLVTMFIVAYLCTRFRDFTQVINSIVSLLFFATPIFWYPSMLGEYRLYINANPIYHLIEIIRGPLLGGNVVELNYYFSLAYTLVLFIVAYLIHVKFSKKIVFWL